MKVLGRIITCMARVSILGAMEGSTKENTIWIKSMVMVYTIGPMGESMKGTGQMESNMEKGSTCCQQV